MKKIAIGLVVIAVVGCVGYTSYSLVSLAKAKSENAISSEKSESAKTGDSDTTQSTEKEVENSKENSPESIPNNAPSSSSPTDYMTFDNENSDDSSEKMLDFSSPDAFILSYNNLIDDIGTDVTRESIRSDYYKAAMTITSAGNVEVWSYQYDNSIRVIYIKDTDVSNEIKEHINGSETVTFEEGNTVINIISTN